jgi:hypothetical protein
MTVQYSASNDSALRYYAESKNTSIQKIDDDEKKEVILFRKYLTDVIEEEHLFIKASNELTKK